VTDPLAFSLFLRYGPIFPALEKKEYLQMNKELRNAYAVNYKEMGKIKDTYHHVKLTTDKPIQAPYMFRSRKPQDIALEKENAEKLLEANIIEPSDSAYNAPVILIKKKDGSIRFCIDYREINKYTVRDAYPMHNTQEVLDQLGSAKYWTVLDAFSGYNQIPIWPEDRHKTAFSCNIGHFQCVRMMFGMCNSGATFQRAMNNMLGGARWKYALCYVDDIIIYSATFEDHIKHLRSVLQCCIKSGVTLKPSKCVFGADELKYLGHIISREGVQPDPSYTASVSKFPEPRTPRQLRSFLGMTNYARRFIYHYAQIAAPLTRLLKKSNQAKHISFGDAERAAFVTLKKKLVSAPIMAHPDWSQPFGMSTDGSKAGVSATLFQGQVGTSSYHVIAYYSRPLKKYEENYFPYELEALAVVQGIDRYRPYLEGSTFDLVTDHKALTKIRDTKEPNSRVWRWTQSLHNFQWNTIYRKGEENTSDDGMSRVPCNEDQGHIVTEDEVIPDPSIFVIEVKSEEKKSNKISDEEVSAVQQQDKYLAKFIAYKTKRERPKDVNKSEFYSKAENLVWDEQRKLLLHVTRNRNLSNVEITTVAPDSLKYRIWNDIHVKGHFSWDKDLEIIARDWYWDNMMQQIKQKCDSCTKCQKGDKSGDTNAKGNVSAPHTVPQTPWSVLQIDLTGHIGAKKTSQGNTCIVCISDELTGFAIWRPIPDSSWKAVWMAIKPFVRAFGEPEVLRADSGSAFTSDDATALMKAEGIVLAINPPLNKQSNGQVERMIRTLHSMQRKAGPTVEWDTLVDDHMLALNDAKNATTGFSPFYLMFGRDARQPNTQRLNVRPLNRDPEDILYNKLRQQHDAWVIAQERRQQAVDKRVEKSSRTATIYNEGDQVMTYMPHHDKGAASKHEIKWDGPFTVKKVLGNNKYELHTHDRRKKIITRHANQLSAYHSPQRDTIQPPPRTDIKLRVDDIPEDGAAPAAPAAKREYSAGDYDIEGIVEHQGNTSNNRQYHIAFKGQDNSHDRWYTQAELSDAKELVTAYNKKFNLPEDGKTTTSNSTSTRNAPTKRRYPKASSATTSKSDATATQPIASTGGCGWGGGG
jgi:hypothetical protein